LGFFLSAPFLLAEGKMKLSKFSEGVRGKSVLVNGTRYPVTDAAPAVVTVEKREDANHLIAAGWKPVDAITRPEGARPRGRPRKNPVDDAPPPPPPPPSVPPPAPPGDPKMTKKEAKAAAKAEAKAAAEKGPEEPPPPPPEEVEAPLLPPPDEVDDIEEALAAADDVPQPQHLASTELGIEKLMAMAKSLKVKVGPTDKIQQIVDKINEVLLNDS